MNEVCQDSDKATSEETAKGKKNSPQKAKESKLF